MERIHMKLEVRKLEASSKLNELFRMKVQLEEQLKEVETQIHYHRGFIHSVNETQKFVRELQSNIEAEAIAEAQANLTSEKTA